MLPGVLTAIRVVYDALINVDDCLTCEEIVNVLYCGGLPLPLVVRTVHQRLHWLDAAEHHFQLHLEEAIDLRLRRKSDTDELLYIL